MDVRRVQAERSTTSSDDADERLVAYLAAHHASCPLCRYNLRGLTSARCPECGQALRLTVGLAEPFLRAWIVLVVSAWCGAGTGLLFLVGIAAQGLQGAPILGLVSILCLIAAIPVGILSLLLRRRFLKLPPSHQWMIASASEILTVGGYLLFVAAVAMT